jgi:hypothetical protein
VTFSSSPREKHFIPFQENEKNRLLKKIYRMDDDETNQQTNDPAKQFRTLLLAKTKNLLLLIKDMQRRRVHSLVFNSTKYQQISPSFIMFDTSKEREKGGENLIIQKKNG